MGRTRNGVVAGDWTRMGMIVAMVAAAGLAASAFGQGGDQPGAEDQDAGAAARAAARAMAAAGGDEEGDGLRPWAEVSKGFTRVISTVDDRAFYGLWKKDRDGSLLAELPRGWEGQRHYFALTVATGEAFAGLQSGELYVYWKRVANRLMLIEPQIEVRSTGDPESKGAIKQIFTDRVIIDVPIVATGPSGQPVIDLKNLLTDNAGTFFGGWRVAGANTRVAQLKSAKAFPENIEVSYVMPTRGGRLQEFHYSISLIPDNTGYQPRVADERVGYFTTWYRDLGKKNNEDKWVRYITRWHVEKRDPKLELSPPKQPIVFYIDAATPVRYRQAVRDGILRWNKAFERVGIINAIEVYQQDAQTGAHMDKDPEDVRYNFVRWLANDQGTAIGPSRIHPLTGQILDADIILTDGWIRFFWSNFNELLPELAMDGMSPETLAWLETRPQYDPRLRLADPARRNELLAQRARRGILAYGGHPIGMALEGGDSRLVGDRPYDGLARRGVQAMGLCMAAQGKSMDVAFLSMASEMLLAMDEPAEEPAGEAKGDTPEDAKKDEKKGAKKPKLNPDGIPDWFVNPLLADLTAHEVGHTLGLRHNFKASAQYTWDEIKNQIKGQKPFTASVMDYNPVNLIVEDGKIRGDVAMIDIGEYDLWAIEYGYTTGDLKEVLKRVSEPALAYQTDEDTSGTDPHARRYDFAKDTLNWAKDRMALAQWHRSRLLDRFAKDGESWSRVRRGYNITLGIHLNAVSTMARWVGGTFVNRDRKGDPGNRDPLTPVPVQDQRDALAWVLQNSFRDDAFGLSTELLEKMTVDKWWDDGGMGEVMADATFPVHDRIAGIQASVMTMLINPTTLRRIYDNEFKIPQGQDALTLPEFLDAIDASVWSELESGRSGSFTARKPMISSLRRNLQREHLERMIDLTLPNAGFTAAYKPISNLVVFRLRTLKDRIDGIIGKDGRGSGLDPYSVAHLSEASKRIEMVLNPSFIYNQSGGVDPFMFWMLMGQEGGQGQNQFQDPVDGRLPVPDDFRAPPRRRD